MSLWEVPGEQTRELMEDLYRRILGMEGKPPQFVPNLTIKRIPDGTHWVIHEKPTLVNEYIREFISPR